MSTSPALCSCQWRDLVTAPGQSRTSLPLRRYESGCGYVLREMTSSGSYLDSSDGTQKPALGQPTIQRCAWPLSPKTAPYICTYSVRS